MARSSHLEAELDLPLPREVVFAFFADPHNLEAITPPWLRFRIVTPGPLEMRTGALIDYRLSLRGIPFGWRTRITVWEPPERFVDEQLRGPYRLWRHEHRFEERGGGTRILDRVEYQVPGGALVERLLVRPDLERIFAWRRTRVQELLLEPRHA